MVKAFPVAALARSGFFLIIFDNRGGVLLSWLEIFLFVDARLILLRHNSYEGSVIA